MKPAPFDHVAPATVEDAVALLGSEPGACVLAGGQSLVPLLALRRARPTLLVDVNGLALDHVEPGPGGPADGVRLGALVRHRRLERDDVVRRLAPLLAEAARWVGHPSVRHRGTLGGSLAFADPAAELPCALVALGGEVAVRSTDGERTVAAADLFAAPFATTLAPGELLVEVRVPAPGPGHGAAYCEWAARHNDRAEAGVAFVVERGTDGRCTSVRAAAAGVAGTPLDLSDGLAALVPGEAAATDGLLRAVATTVERAAGELAGLLAARALRLAFGRAA